MDAIPFAPNELPPDYHRVSASDPPPHYAKFHGNISIELPKDRPGVERSGFAAWRTADPAWTLFGRVTFNCESHAFLALRVKADTSKYFINLQPDSMVVSDLYQHRLFPKTPGEWETIYVSILVVSKKTGTREIFEQCAATQLGTKILKKSSVMALQCPESFLHELDIDF